MWENAEMGRPEERVKLHIKSDSSANQIITKLITLDLSLIVTAQCRAMECDSSEEVTNIVLSRPTKNRIYIKHPNICIKYMRFIIIICHIYHIYEY